MRGRKGLDRGTLFSCKLVLRREEGEGGEGNRREKEAERVGEGERRRQKER